MDTWCEKRPGYAAGSIPEKKCLNVASMTSNYYVSCSTTGGKMPTYDELTLIKFAEISIKNNDTVSRQLRVGFKRLGTSDTITWASYQTLNAGVTGTYVLEGIAANQNYAVYVQCPDYISFYTFVDSSYVSTITDGYGYFEQVLTGTAQKSPKVIEIYAAQMSIQLQVITSPSNTPMDVEIWRSGTIYYQQNTLDVTFDIPWNTIFSVIISGVNTTHEYDTVTAECYPDPRYISGNTNGAFDAVYNDISGCEYEFCTGQIFQTNKFVIDVSIP